MNTTLLRIRSIPQNVFEASRNRNKKFRTDVRMVLNYAMFDERPTEPITPEQRQISDELMSSMQTSIKEALETDDVTVEDVYGNYQHVSIRVVSNVFEGLNAVKRQRLVYKAIWQELQSTVHAVDEMITMTPEEAAQKLG